MSSLSFLFADEMRVDYASEMHNVELNRWTRWGDWSWLAGFRFVNLDEEFNIHAVNTLTGDGDYQIRAYNHLIGGQLGARRVGQWGRLGWDVTGKAGLFGNVARQRQVVLDFPPGFVLRDAEGSETALAFVGDLSFSATWKLTDVWAVRGGYNLLWLEGLALAPDQLDLTFVPDSGTAVQTGGAFLHGAHVGLEAAW